MKPNEKKEASNLVKFNPFLCLTKTLLLKSLSLSLWKVLLWVAL